MGEEVRQQFLTHDAAAISAFAPSENPGKWLANLPMLAKQRLVAAGAASIYGGDRCTFSESEHFFSYRRDGQTGRMASFIYIQAD